MRRHYYYILFNSAWTVLNASAVGPLVSWSSPSVPRNPVIMAEFHFPGMIEEFWCFFESDLWVLLRSHSQGFLSSWFAVSSSPTNSVHSTSNSSLSHCLILDILLSQEILINCMIWLFYLDSTYHNYLSICISFELHSFSSDFLAREWKWVFLCV